jgi:hypothetical protein
MPKEKLMPRCPYCDGEMKYVVLDMVRRTARLYCPTCDSEFPPKEEEMTMTTKPRNRVLTVAEASAQNKKTARVWLELRANIPIRAWLKTDAYPWRVIPYNIGIGTFYVFTEDYGTKWRCWEKEPTREETKREPWSEP